MAEKPQLPPPNKMIRELITPNHGHGFFRELVSRQSPRFLKLNPIKRGTKYVDCEGGEESVNRVFPDLYFLKETVPIGSNTVAGMTQHEFVIWNWSTDLNGQSSFNAEISYLGDAVTNPVFARQSIIRRDTFETNQSLATGVPFTGLLGAKVIVGGTQYTHATATFVGPGTGAEIEFVISDGSIVDAIIIHEGEGLTAATTINVVGDGQDAEVQPIIQPAGAILTSQKKLELPDGDPFGHEFVRVLRVWELLPGPWIPFTRYDENLGPIQGRRRAVLNTGQSGGVISPTGMRNYEGRDGSSVVSIEIEESFSDGTGVPGPGGEPNPPYPVFIWDLYVDERGPVERRSQVVRATGSEVGSFTRNGPFAIRTWFEPYRDNPFLLIKFIETWREVVTSDRRIVREFGGGETRIDTQTGVPGAQTVDSGLRVLSSELVTRSPQEQTKKTEQLIVGEWPILHGHHTDEITGIVVNFTKQVVPEGTPYPGRSGYRGPFIEMQPYDRWRSIQIVSAVDLNTLPGPEAWWVNRPFTLPPTLLSIEAIWSDVVGKSADSDDENVSVAVNSGASGGIIVTSRNGFRGYAKMIQARDYFYGPPPEASVPQPLKIIPSSGSVILTQTSSNTFASANDEQADGPFGSTQFLAFSRNGGRVGDQFRRQIQEIDIRDHLVGNFDILNPTHRSQSATASATSGGGTIREVGAFGTQSRMEVRIPQSTPNQLISGQQILHDVELREWRFGVWVLDRFYAIVP